MTDLRRAVSRWTLPLAFGLFALPAPAHACMTGTDAAFLLVVVGLLPAGVLLASQLFLSRAARHLVLDGRHAWAGRMLTLLAVASVVPGLAFGLELCRTDAWGPGALVFAVEYAMLLPVLRAFFGRPRVAVGP